MLEKRTTNISDHYSTQKKISKGEKNLQLIPTRHSNLFSATSM